ncbi:CDP-alcohol phosphatidyltransferase [Kouleothrix aurantiaca]|uniref:CDP-alcohol phosphatidyltransferase n=1 Tax=Kouleothrix aurantiaca TaxID=186479 RepID=A0A0P9FK19_9CHLR|nr:CDP-alcohol phosphatidyltransferase [Kouleothrix aurantiaca]
MKPTLTRFRKGYEQFTIPLGALCTRVGITADMLTMLSLCLGGAAAFAISRRAFLLGVVLILLMTAADVLDGATARAGGTSSPAGMLFDHVVDRYAEFFILLGIMLSGAASSGWTMFALFGMVMASYVRARAEASGKIESCDVGFAGRPEKITMLCVGLFLQPFFPQLRLLQWAVIVVGVFSHITAVQRLLYARRVILGDQGRPRFRKGQGVI